MAAAGGAPERVTFGSYNISSTVSSMAARLLTSRVRATLASSFSIWRPRARNRSRFRHQRRRASELRAEWKAHHSSTRAQGAPY
jgi:hypothetical protein